MNAQCTSVDEQAWIRSVTASLLAFEAGAAEAGVREAEHVFEQVDLVLKVITPGILSSYRVSVTGP